MSTWLSWLKILGDPIHFLCLSLRPRGSLAAENLFLRKQLAFYQDVCGELLILAKSTIRHTQALSFYLSRGPIGSGDFTRESGMRLDHGVLSP